MKGVLLLALLFFAWWLFDTKAMGDVIDAPGTTPPAPPTPTGTVTAGIPMVVANTTAAQAGPSDYLTSETNTGNVDATSTDTP